MNYFKVLHTLTHGLDFYMRDKYKFIGLFYDFGCTFMSGKLIQCCRISNFQSLKPGDKVLFVGVGHGRDALYAAKCGAQVTVLDLSETMLKKFRNVLLKEQSQFHIEEIHSDVLNFHEFAKYDFVVANFFLNVFSQTKMIQILKHLIKLLKQDGQIIVSDFSYPTGGLASRLIINMYWYFIVVIFYFFSGNAIHKIYPYSIIMEELGIQIQETKKFCFLNLNLFSSHLGQKTNSIKNQINSLSSFTETERISYLKKFGNHSMAFSTLQPHVRYFDVNKIGYITYICHKNSVFVLANPICEEKNFNLILSLFLQKFPKSHFIQVTKNVCDILFKNHNYYGTQCGFEPLVSIKSWNLKGKKKNIIRTAMNQVNAQNIELKESEFLNQTHSISRSWIQTRRCKKKEIRFLIRPLSMQYTGGLRYFYAFINSKPIGFVCFDPIYNNEKIIAYVPNISRSSKLFKQGLTYSIIAFAIEIFRKEGIEFIHLGITPMLKQEKIEVQESKILRYLIVKIYQSSSYFYNFKGLEFAKSRFEGEKKKVYYCHVHKLPLISIARLFRLARII